VYKSRILLVDNDIRICRVLEEFLFRRGYYIRTTFNIIDAIKLIKNEEFDIVLYRYFMPKESIFDLASSLNECQNKPYIGIIHTCDEMTDAKLNADFFIRKPINYLELERELINLIGVK
jgi:DNA-binding response OmpR family regulator